MKNKFFFVIVAILLFPFITLSQDLATGNEEEFGVDTSKAAIENDINVKQDITDYLDNKGWSIGDENTKKDGSQFIVAVGYGIIQAPRESKSYVDARRRAFDIAMIKAKAELLKYLETTISTKTEADWQEGEFPKPGEKDKKHGPSIIDKGKMLIHAKLDELLKEKGIDPSSEKAKEEVQKIINSETFNKTIKAVSQSYIAGMQAYKIFEGSPEGKKGKIGVVAIWSEQLNKVASSIATGIKPAHGKTKSNIKSQIPKDKNILLNTFGVRQTRNENGEYVLLAFGQAGAKGRSAMAEEMAEEKANTYAMAYIREFAGETAKRVHDMYDAQTTKELEDGTEVYEDQSAMRLAISTESKKLKIKGIKTIKNWSARHPLNGQTVYGSVVSWSPSSAQRAGRLQQRMSPGSASETKQQVKPVHSGSPESQKGRYKGKSMEGDEDDF